MERNRTGSFLSWNSKLSRIIASQGHRFATVSFYSGEHKVSVSRNQHNIIAAIQNHNLFVTKSVRKGQANKS